MKHYATDYLSAWLQTILNGLRPIPVPVIQRTQLYFVILLMLAPIVVFAQTIEPSTINVTGGYKNTGNYQFEWSVGEATSVVTMSNSNIVITTGVLQSFVAFQPELNTIENWLASEIKVYPNPTRDIVEINILHRLSGKNKLELYDMQGKKVMETQFEYYGTGRVERWDLSKFTAGTYILHIIQLNTSTGQPVKKGAFKILKIQ